MEGFEFESAVQRPSAKFLAWENCPLNSSKRSKTFVSGIDVLLNLPTGFGKSFVFQMAVLVHAEITTPRWICSESSDNCDISSSEHYGRSNKFLTEICHISRLDWRRQGSESED